jgi:prepilin-type N-terminal cleavage/methylation domain-containing protein
MNLLSLNSLPVKLASSFARNHATFEETMMTKETIVEPETSTRRRRGFTLTEIAIVLGIMGLILGAIWVAASSVYTNMRVSTTTRDVISMSQGIRNLYANQGVMDGGLAGPPYTSLINTGVVPNDITTTAGSLVDAWGGTVTFTPATTISTAGDSFVIDLAGVPESGCVGLLTDSSTKSTGSGITGLAAGTTLYSKGLADVGSTTSYTATTAVGSTACGAGAGASVHVGYLFSIH